MTSNMDLIFTYKYQYMVAYSVISIICIIVMNIVSFKSVYGSVKIPHIRYIKKAIWYSCVVVVMDVIWRWISVFNTPIPKEVSYLINELYFLALHPMYFYIFIYFYMEITGKSFNDSKVLKISAPTIIMLIINLINVKFPIMYYISDKGEYIKCAGYPIQYIAPIIYLTIPYVITIKDLIKMKKELLPHKKLHRDILTVPATIAILGIAGIFYNMIPLLTIAICYTITFLYVDRVEDFVTIDPVSSLPNKLEFIEELKKRIDIENLKSRGDLYIIIVDILHLRDINDKYGYNEGDDLVRRVSNVLRRQSVVGSKINAYICRYSGAQYFIVVNSAVPEDIMNYCASLLLKIEKSDTISMSKYKTEIMYGVAKYEGSESIHDLIEKATNNLEENKIRYRKYNS